MRSFREERAKTGSDFGKTLKNTTSPMPSTLTIQTGRPDGLAFDKAKKLCVLLEYTRAMDTNKNE